jgi:hypothetical protein
VSFEEDEKLERQDTQLTGPSVKTMDNSNAFSIGLPKPSDIL